MEINNEVLNKIINDPLRDKTLNCHEYTNGAVYDLATDLLSTRQKLEQAGAELSALREQVKIAREKAYELARIIPNDNMEWDQDLYDSLISDLPPLPGGAE